MFKKIMSWFENKDDVTADIARSNNRWHEFFLEERRSEYIKTLCRQIKIESINGNKSITTMTLRDEIMTYEYMMKIKEYFEQRGFNVKEESNRSGVLTSWLRISWQ